ncbi:hypothetical protein ACQKD8_18360 [Pseudomonas sp. NPDC077405]
MDDIEAAFATLLGRQPSEREVQDLYRVKNALNIRDNDALWLVLMALESYDTLYRKYPEMVASSVSKVIGEQRTVIAAIADAETKRALGTLAEAVARSSQEIAAQTAHSTRIQSVGWMMFCAVAFGALCLVVGFILGSGQLPYWAIPSGENSPARLVLSAIATAPTGWLLPIIALATTLWSLWLERHAVMSGRRLGLVATAIGFGFVSIWLAASTGWVH